MEKNGNQTRKHYSLEQKVKIHREHLENQIPLSELSEKYGIPVNDLYHRKKKLFEGAVEIFPSKRIPRCHRRKGKRASQAKAEIRWPTDTGACEREHQL
ncbi:MAG TPA: transposase [Candidatus Kryptonia bacterium]